MPITRLIIAVWLVGVAALTSVSATAEDAKRPDKVSFYFAAHEDDWQLFMNPSAFQDVMNGAAKTVFVHLTAGGAGGGGGGGGGESAVFYETVRFSGRDERGGQDRFCPSHGGRRGLGRRQGWAQTSVLSGARERRGSCDPVHGGR